MTPSAFISYSWDDDAHKEWVRTLAKRLRADGVDVTLDRWAAVPGDQLTTFMERSIRENQFIIIICTPRYKSRSDSREGGVGYEGDIMTAEVMTQQNNRKFIPVLRGGTWSQAAPSWLLGKLHINLSGDPYSALQYQELVCTLFETREPAPAIGEPMATLYPNLTSLPKQKAFIKRASKLERSKTPYVIALIDLDQFKQINDTMGFDKGDMLLEIVASTIKNRLGGPVELVARYGGDEFAILYRNTPPEEIAKALNELNDILVESATAAGLPPITASVGVSSDRLESIDSKLEDADRAIMLAKKEGRGRVIFQLRPKGR